MVLVTIGTTYIKFQYICVLEGLRRRGREDSGDGLAAVGISHGFYPGLQDGLCLIITLLLYVPSLDTFPRWHQPSSLASPLWQSQDECKCSW